MADEKKNISREQKDILVSFMEDNLDFARGRIQKQEGRITFKNLWLILVEQLNSAGKQKNEQQWQRTWTDIKIKVKRKVCVLKASRMKTRGGPMTDIGITDFDERVIKILSEDAVFGIEGPENISLESDEPRKEKEVVELSLVVAGPSGLQQTSKRRKTSSTWVQNVEYLEERAQEITRVDFANSTPTNVSEISEEDEAISTPRRVGRKSVAATAAKELKQLHGETNKKIDGLINEVGKLNNKLDVLIDQNTQLMTHRVQTNNILERIARALEGQYL